MTARALARILLPGQLKDGTRLSWLEIAGRVGREMPVDGYTDWVELVEIRPEDDGPEYIPRAAAGWIDPLTGHRLIDGFGEFTALPWNWSAAAQWDVDALTARADVSGDVVQARLEDLVGTWSSSGFRGRAWSDDVALIEAPPYADSLLVSASPPVLASLAEAGLEIHRVSRARKIPIWQD